MDFRLKEYPHDSNQSMTKKASSLFFHHLKHTSI